MFLLTEVCVCIISYCASNELLNHLHLWVPFELNLISGDYCIWASLHNIKDIYFVIPRNFFLKKITLIYGPAMSCNVSHLVLHTVYSR